MNERVPPGRAAAGRPKAADRLTGIRTIFRRNYLLATMLFAAATFCGLLLVYGINTWLPNIMRTAGFELGSSLLFLLVLNIGGIVGTTVASRLADRVGVKRVAAPAIAGFARRPPASRAQASGGRGRE